MMTTLCHQPAQWSGISSGYAFSLQSCLPTCPQQKPRTGHRSHMSSPLVALVPLQVTCSLARHCPREDESSARETHRSLATAMTNLLPSSENGINEYSFWNALFSGPVVLVSGRKSPHSLSHPTRGPLLLRESLKEY